MDVCGACEEEDAEGMLLGGADDKLDISAVDAAVEHNVLAPLRARGERVPRGELSRQDAWRLAHAATFTPAVDGEYDE